MKKKNKKIKKSWQIQLTFFIFVHIIVLALESREC